MITKHIALPHLCRPHIVGCPDCGAPAEVTEWFTLPSTDGPVDHMVVVCAERHRFRMPAEGISPRRVGSSLEPEGGPNTALHHAPTWRGEHRQN